MANPRNRVLFILPRDLCIAIAEIGSRSRIRESKLSRNTLCDCKIRDANAMNNGRSLRERGAMDANVKHRKEDLRDRGSFYANAMKEKEATRNNTSRMRKAVRDRRERTPEAEYNSPNNEKMTWKKPIIKMLEEIRQKVMNLMKKHKEEVRTWSNEFSPKSRELYNEFMEIAQVWQVNFNGEIGYEVIEGSDKHCVNLSMKKCTCRVWDLTEIPCPHVIRDIIYNRGDPLTEMHWWYSKESKSGLTDFTGSRGRLKLEFKIDRVRDPLISQAQTNRSSRDFNPRTPPRPFFPIFTKSKKKKKKNPKRYPARLPHHNSGDQAYTAAPRCRLSPDPTQLAGKTPTTTRRKPATVIRSRNQPPIFKNKPIRSENQEKVSENLNFQEVFESKFAARLLRFSGPVRFQSRFFGPSFHTTAAVIGKYVPFEVLVHSSTASSDQEPTCSARDFSHVLSNSHLSSASAFGFTSLFFLFFLFSWIETSSLVISNLRASR
uniref:Uncharacterized protein LOC104243946 n=1 Tax=Nicotiana sylvestris TaxID=4096 RepID=A0A1U7Y324_NICSY|nr:PREDICTED: uncharacterized protein LOC104243946 [Nicotiana sylvestris]